MADRPWIALLPLLLVAAVFAPVLGFDFAWDDGNLVVRNQALLRPDVWLEAWRQDFWALTNNPGESGMYRPLVLLTYAAERRLWGLQPGPWHGLNLLLHLAGVGLVWQLARHLGAGRAAAGVGSAVFGVHPVQVLAVANVASRTDLLATAGVLLACRLALSARWWPASALALLAALLSKESAVIGPLLIDLCVLGSPRPGPRRAMRVGLPWLVLLAYTVLRLAVGVLPGGGEGGSFAGGWRYLAYTGRVLLPTVQMPYAELVEPGLFLALLSLLLPMSLAALCVAPFLPRLVKLGLAWFLVALLPVAELLPLGARYSDLLLHLPLAGIGLLAAGLVDLLPARLRPATVLLPGALAVLAAWRLPHWADNTALWSWTLEHRPGHPEATLNLAVALRAEGQIAEGCRLLSQAVSAAGEGRDRDTLVRASYNLGNCALEAGRPDAAAQLFRQSAEAAGRAFLPAEYGLAAALLELGQAEQALQVSTPMVQRWPDDARGWRVHGAALASTGRYAEAIEALDRCLALAPDDAQAQDLRQRARARIDPG